MRIASLLPSGTEIVCSLGLFGQLVGVSHECDFPEVVQSLPRLTKTRLDLGGDSHKLDAIVRESALLGQPLIELDIQTLRRVAPDLIIAQSLCSVCSLSESQVRQVLNDLPGRPDLLLLEPHNLEDVLQSLHLVADAAGVSARSGPLEAQLRARIAEVACRIDSLPRIPTVLLEWLAPLYSAGHWCPELVELAGGIELLGHAGVRSRAVAWEELQQVNPSQLIIACCGFSLDRANQDLPHLLKHAGFRDLACAREGGVALVDGNAWFSRPGPRLIDGLETLVEMLHPQLPRSNPNNTLWRWVLPGEWS